MMEAFLKDFSRVMALNSEMLSVMRFCDDGCVSGARRMSCSTHRGGAFDQHLVVLADGDNEYERCDVLEAVNPLAAL